MSEVLQQWVDKPIRVTVVSSDGERDEVKHIDGYLNDFDAQWVNLKTHDGTLILPVHRIRSIRPKGDT